MALDLNELKIEPETIRFPVPGGGWIVTAVSDIRKYTDAGYSDEIIGYGITVLTRGFQTQRVKLPVSSSGKIESLKQSIKEKKEKGTYETAPVAVIFTGIRARPYVTANMSGLSVAADSFEVLPDPVALFGDSIDFS